MNNEIDVPTGKMDAHNYSVQVMLEGNDAWPDFDDPLYIEEPLTLISAFTAANNDDALSRVEGLILERLNEKPPEQHDEMCRYWVWGSMADIDGSLTNWRDWKLIDTKERKIFIGQQAPMAEMTG